MGGIVGMYSFGKEKIGYLTYKALYAMQHRGQESAAIISSGNHDFIKHEKNGLVFDAFQDFPLEKFTGTMAIGQVSHQPSKDIDSIPPLCYDTQHGEIAITHTGKIVNSNDLKEKYSKEGSIFKTELDAEIMIHVYAQSKSPTLEGKIQEIYNQIPGAFSSIMMTSQELIVIKDSYGFMPLCMGKKDNAYIFASESCVLDMLKAQYLREIEPGEMIVVNKNGFSAKKMVKDAHPHSCVFNLIYYARPDSIVFGKQVSQQMEKFAQKLAEEDTIQADIVIPVPDAGNHAALGYSKAKDIPFDLALIRSHYSGRAFSSQEKGNFGIEMKFSVIKDKVKDKEVMVVDDSLYTAKTAKKINKILREAGAKKIHNRYNSPQIFHLCPYGIPNREELIAPTHSLKEITKTINADSLKHLSVEGLKSCLENPEDYCFACFDGNFPLK